MSRTYHHTKFHFYTRHWPKGRANIYGICHCANCKAFKHSSGAHIEKIKGKWKRAWKSNKEFTKGFYPS